MAASRRLRDLQSHPGNKICVDCSQKNPQWASVSYGIFMFLVLRSHLLSPSFDLSPWTHGRRSSSGKWSPAATKTSTSSYRSTGFQKRDIVSKYNTNTASVYRDRIQALADGKSWQDPPVVKEILMKTGGGKKPPVPMASGGRAGSNGGWDSDWGDSGFDELEYGSQNNNRKNQSTGDFRSSGGTGSSEVLGGINPFCLNGFAMGVDVKSS